MYFSSLIAPNFAGANDPTLSFNLEALPRKIHLKKSYLALSWLNYLSSKVDNFSTETNIHVTKSRTTHLAIMPSKRSLYTLTKAPMAHKTNSKEQFMFRFYFFKFSTYVSIDPSNTPSTIDEARLFSFLVSRTFPAFETNLLFLKYYQLSFPYRENVYYNYSLFSVI